MDIALARHWVQAIAVAMDEHQDRLTQLDSAIGDADHGANMHRGFNAVLATQVSYRPDSVGQLLVKVGSTLISSVGGASGPLYGTAFRAAGKALPGTDPDAAELLAALRAGLDAVRELGAAAPGDKTMVDAFLPALDAFEEELRAGGDLGAAAARAARAAEDGARATVPLQARKGRASYLGPRSIGHQDPGATSTALVFGALATAAAAR
ncbi:dihydroxyacetone kinase subunit L [Kitasatospora herbaricolor]|uniref:dihydroxyacetone kinase subunit DhaL n=1 Tax=Kitasatospora herbaricolor TaxID=68217 RepID=UPI00174AE402|nr:dihydroxyacetone kinase subunit DhaL [Kitasatospora herbaricolor]MDQ0306575.1 dihydroxyacetone kinase-like protein [Kitasatospora herbaricolor]GGV33698.1 dihydroxyacetone kinase subunit L [Kitasatospora herbaricolor]